MGLGSGLDSLISVFSPSAALRRKVARDGLRKYAAAKITPETGAWNPVDSGVNDEIGGSKSAVNARVRQLARDMPHFARALNIITDYVVGDGLRPEPMVKLPGSDQTNDKLNAEIEDAWNRFADSADSAQRLHAYEMQRLAKRQETEVGEHFMVRRIDRRRDTYLPITYTQFEGDVISDLSGYLSPAVGKHNAYDYGVEYNGTTGEVKAYHIQLDDGPTVSSVTRVPASQAVHGFETLRPGQVRGITPFAPGVLMAHSLRSYLEAEMSSAQIAARVYEWVSVPDPANAQTAFGAQYSDTFERKIEEVGNAVREYLAPGETVIPNNYSRPGDSFTPYTKFVLRAFSIVTGVAYPLLTNDYDEISYSNHRGLRNDMLKTIKPMTSRLVRQWCTPVYHDFLDWLALSGRVDMPGYFRDPWVYRRVAWLGPGVESIDPLREGKADTEAIQNLIKSPIEVIRGRGRDPEEVLDEIAIFKEMAKERDLEVTTTSTGTKTNPAALGASEEEDERGETLIVMRG